ncbi:MAG: hypothetical protein M0Q23_05015 [Syntrophales bacterium]|jgi:hypothetical protein|nr:hypothetical protein [Syntrophales bacterium]MCK9528001.1 hypothetical protein [Syntrophales bacterium]MDX9921422.1 hypothetical protein [Syntrophales bacterium]
MDLKAIARQMIQFHEAAFDNTFDAMTVMQQQAEEIIADWINRNPLITAEGQKTIDRWLAAYRKSREDFKAVVDDNYKKVEQSLEGYQWTPPSTTAGRPGAAKARPARKAEPVKVRRSPKAPKKETPAKKQAPVKGKTNIDIVTRLIQRSTEGISTAYIKEKTGLTERQIWNIVNNAAREGKIKKLKRGVYCAVPKEETKAEPGRVVRVEPKKGTDTDEKKSVEEAIVTGETVAASQESADSAVPEPRGEG